ncbi:hypothetical protein HJC23_010664 [Cyclotella cryptica]|uniref:ABC transporter domain-containing protein n=1 Tax=Cyclotella cryptica TaxID=29204 RepID=A0ABD3PFJ7_9STRA|eukprot:CCRYP_015177-RA/>CCRYP_015177-RA protein AED:0.32 eAED:0.32 QI:102/1/1/1/1/1/2/62/820
MNSILDILDGNIPALDSEVKDYIGSLIEAALEDGDCDSLSETMKEFLSEETSQQIIDELRTLTVANDPVSSASVPSPGLLSHQSPPSSPQLLPTTLDEIGDEFNSSPLSTKPPDGTATKSKLKQRKESRLAKKKGKSSNRAQTLTPTENNHGLVDDDHASAWTECKASNKLWGGKGKGGRGIRITGDNFEAIHLPTVSICYEGNELLVDSKMDIIKGHRYALLGRNGVGKSTLLKQIESGGIPGLPRGLVVRMVKQQVEGKDDETTLQALVNADQFRTELLEEQEKLEKEMDDGVNMEHNAQRLSELAVELDAIDSDNAEQRALDILKGLSFSDDMIHSTTAKLSGGWRMRLALAQALFVPYSDLLLLDEVTNHLDLNGMSWLERHLTDESRQDSLTLICVSHDRSFLDAVCTDVIVMEHKRLTYHSGNYSDYRQKMTEKAARESQILDAAERQRSKAEAFVQKQQQSKKSSDPNKQRQAKMIKEKKMERIGNYREDGKRYKLNSLKKLSEDYVRLAQKVQIEVDDPVVKIRLPDPVWPPSIADGSPLISLEDLGFAYVNGDRGDSKVLLRKVTANVTRKTKVAIVGRNGCGKTTLMKLLLGEIAPTQGKIWVHPNIRVKSISQYSVEELEQYSQLTVVQYAEDQFASGSASSEVISKASGNVRQYLGAFGLGGSHAHRLIEKLSGGERMRLCFATALADSPHILLLDESTNHVDLETLDSLAEALRVFKGAILMVSHNQAFLGNFCNELWAIDDKTGTVSISKNDTESFDELFSQYRSRVLTSGGRGALSRQRERQVKAGMAKQAAKQMATAKTNTALL